jgi:hypothetical protein
MRVYVGLIMVSCLFLSFLLTLVEYNRVLAKVDWLAVCIALRVVGVYCLFPPAFAKNLHNPPANGKQGLGSKGPEEIFQTLLTNKKLDASAKGSEWINELYECD